MKTARQQRIEILVYSSLSGVLGLAIGYYWAALMAAEMVRENLK